MVLQIRKIKNICHLIKGVSKTTYIQLAGLGGKKYGWSNNITKKQKKIGRIRGYLSLLVDQYFCLYNKSAPLNRSINFLLVSTPNYKGSIMDRPVGRIPYDEIEILYEHFFKYKVCSFPKFFMRKFLYRKLLVNICKILQLSSIIYRDQRDLLNILTLNRIT